MASDLVDHDIKKYVVSQLKKDTNLCRLSTATKDKIELTLAKKADGMLRWVFCQLYQLKKLQLAQRKDINQVLDTLPATLDEIYKRILNDIDGKECEKNSMVRVLQKWSWMREELRQITLRIGFDAPNVEYLFPIAWSGHC